MASTEHLQPSVSLGADVVKIVGAPCGGVHGYSSSGHSDASHHPNGVANVNSTDTSRQGSLEAAAPGASATKHVVPAPSSVPAALDEAVDVQQSGTASTPANTAYIDPAAAAAAAVKQELGVSAAAVRQMTADGLAAVKDEQEAPGSPAAVAQLPANPTPPPLSPLPAPDATEPPEVQAEYAVYMERFKAGDTLAQRWHRLAEKGKLEDIHEEWEEWQQDLMLQKLQAQIQAADKGRKRKQIDSDLDPDAPRQTRNRRAPSNLQDYQVEAPAASGPGAAGVREDTPGLASGRPTGAANGRSVVENGSDDADENYSEEPERAAAGRASRGGQQQQQRGSRGVYRPPPPVLTQQPRGGMQQQQQAWGRWQQQQQPAGMMGAVGQPGMSQDLMNQLYQMGTAMGAALQNSGASGAAAGQGAAVPTNGAMQAALEMCTRMWGSDPAVLAQHMQALMQQAHH